MKKTLLHLEKGHGKVCVCVKKKIGGIISAFCQHLWFLSASCCRSPLDTVMRLREAQVKPRIQRQRLAHTYTHTHTERENEKMYVRERKHNENEKKLNSCRKKHCEERKKRHAKSVKNVEGEHMKSERKGNASHSRRWFLSEKHRFSFALCIFSRFVSLECIALSKRFRREKDAPLPLPHPSSSVPLQARVEK